MYTLTLIRLSLLELQFENTEINSFFLLSDIEKQLAKNNADFEQVERMLNMKKGDSITIQVNNTDKNKVWFYYISKFN